LPFQVDTAARKLPGGHLLNAAAAALSLVLLFVYLGSGGSWALVLLTLAGLFIGYHLIMGIGGADMPVVVSMLNSYSGWAAAAIGFSLGNDLLIVVGALVGSSGAILSYIMCKAMNRSFVSVILGGFGGDQGPAQAIEGEHDRDRCRWRGRGAGRRRQRHHRAGLRHGGGTGAATQCQRTDPCHAQGGQGGALRHPSGGRPAAGAHERASGRGQGAL
jgi:hypothetical protein